MQTTLTQSISDNGVSKVWREGDWIYKHQPKFMTDNEIWCLEQMYPSGYVPYAEQVEMELIRLEWIENEPVTDADIFRWNMIRALQALQEAGIHHGDLTEKNVLVKNNRPFLIDFSESRLTCDPRPAKRREGDKYWAKETIRRLCDIDG